MTANPIKAAVKDCASSVAVALAALIIITSVIGWLAFVNGRIEDNDNNSGMASRVVEIYEVCKSQAFAA